MPTTYEQDVQGNLIAQYQESPVLISFFEALASEADVLGNAAIGTIEGRTLNDAVGVQLDIIGSLVGASRIVTDAILIEFFGYDPDPTSLGFSDLGDPAVGGRYRSADESTVSTRSLSDTDYRIYILGTIYKNITRVTGNQILEATIRLFELIDGVAPVVTVEDGDMYYYVFVGRSMSENDKLLIQTLDLLPKTLGVRSFYVSYNPGDSGDPNAPAGYFGFSEDSNALGFGSLKDSDFSAWTPINGGTVTPNTDTAPDGTQTADTINDTDPASYQGITKDLTPLIPWDKTLPVTVTWRIKKDAIPKTTRFVLFDLFMGADGCALKLDTSTGEIDVNEVSGNPIKQDAGVVDRGTYWQVYMVGLAANISATTLFVEFYPAVGADPDYVNSVTTTGSAVLWGFEAYQSYGQRQLDSNFAAMTQVPIGVVTSDTDIAPDGTQTADTLTDNSITDWELVYEDVTAKFIDKAAPMIAAVRFKKDTVSKAERFCLLRIQFLGGGPNVFADITIDTSTGEIAVIPRYDGVPILDAGIIDLGTYWILYLVAKVTDLNYTDCTVAMFPAVGAGDLTIANYSASTVGSAVFWGLETYQGWSYNTYPTILYRQFTSDFAALPTTGTDVVTSNTDIAPDGTRTADTLTDDDPTSWENVQSDITPQYTNLDLPMIVAARVKKDSVPKTTRFSTLRLRFSGSLIPEYGDILLDTSTGEFIQRVSLADIQPDIVGIGVLDLGTYWLAYVIVKPNSIDNVNCSIEFFPSSGIYRNDFWEYTPEALGSIVAWGLEWYQGTKYIPEEANDPNRFNNGGEFATLFST